MRMQARTPAHGAAGSAEQRAAERVHVTGPHYQAQIPAQHGRQPPPKNRGFLFKTVGSHATLARPGGASEAASATSRPLTPGSSSARSRAG